MLAAGKLPQPFQGLHSIDIRHVDVHEDQVGASGRGRGQQIQRFPTAGGGRNLGADLAEQVTEDVPVLAIIVHHEHGDAVTFGQVLNSSSRFDAG